MTHLPATAKQVFDVSGAGDTVIATLAGGLLAGLSPADSCRLANLAAGVVGLVVLIRSIRNRVKAGKQE